jgi:folate-binding protein YgfZ
MSEQWAGYHAATTRVALADRTSRCRIAVTGPDRAKFLHNLTTNEIKRLPVGEGCEAFVTSLQGKTLGYVLIMACESELLVRSDPEGLAQILPHFQKYGLFDEVGIESVATTTFEFHLAGPDARDVLERIGAEPPDGLYAHRIANVGGASVRLIRESPTGRVGWTLIGHASDADRVAKALRENGAPGGLVDLSNAEFEVLRIEAGTPVFGHDVTQANLPQELDRDARAISFVKGCYLGQETVARIDALGHVNRLLKGLTLAQGPPPPPGTALEAADGKAVGAVTSSAWSPGWGRALALAYVRTTHAAPGTELRLALSGSASATVSDLPMLPPVVR